MTNKIDTVLKAITDRITGALPSDTVKNPKLSTTPVLSACSYPTKDPQCSTHIHSSINAITIHPKQPEESQVNEPDVGQEEKGNLGNINSNPHPQPDPLASITTEQIIQNDDEPRKEGPNEGEGAGKEEPMVDYFDTLPTRDELTDLNSPLNIMTRMMYNWIMRRKLDPRENANGGISFAGRIKGMHVFIGNFSYVVDFMIVEDISSIIDPRLSQVVLGRPFIEISNMTHDLPEGVVRNEEDKRRGVDYVMSKLLGFYKECLELGPEYVTGLDDE
ncbi:hypothetical protein Tco_1193108 [Tanacetum coccineum]